MVSSILRRTPRIFAAPLSPSPRVSTLSRRSPTPSSKSISSARLSSSSRRGSSRGSPRRTPSPVQFNGFIASPSTRSSSPASPAHVAFSNYKNAAFDVCKLEVVLKPKRTGNSVPPPIAFMKLLYHQGIKHEAAPARSDGTVTVRLHSEKAMLKLLCLMGGNVTIVPL